MTMSGGRRGESGSIPVALLVTIVAMLMSALMASILSVKVVTARSVMQAPRALGAAQAGLQAAIGNIRMSVDNQGKGRRTALPCGPLAGDVNANGTRYTVTIEYKTVGATTIACTSGSGVATTPVYALLESTGGDPTTGTYRTLTGRYTLTTTNQNIAGGLIHVWPVTGSPDLCLDAGAAVPAAGTAVTVRACALGSDRQKWAYTDQLELRLVSSATDVMPLGMCLDAGPTPHPDTNVTVVMQPCQSPVPYRHRWAVNSFNNFEGTDDGINLDNHCLKVQVPGTDASPVVLSTGSNVCGKIHTNYVNWSPDPAAGAGAAGAERGQLVNYFQFSRCLDVPGFDTRRRYMWAWPCKQDPGALSWNQKWATPAIAAGGTGSTGTISTMPKPTTKLCLQSPLSTTVVSYATLATCSSPPAYRQTWTMYGNTGLYLTSYTILDSAGNCLAAQDPTTPGAVRDISGRISRIVLEECNGSTRQKWNADPNELRPIPLTDIYEK